MIFKREDFETIMELYNKIHLDDMYRLVHRTIELHQDTD